MLRKRKESLRYFAALALICINHPNRNPDSNYFEPSLSELRSRNDFGIKSIGDSMRTTVVGKACNLSIFCENADKRLLGNVYVEGRAFICEVFREEHPNEQFPQNVEGFISIFAQGSEAFRRILVVRNLDSRYQTVIDRYADLRNLTTFDIEGAKLFISVMLGATDFDYFIDFIERNFFTELQYVMDLPFYALPANAEEQASVSAKYGYILPTRREFQSGKPCFFPNDGISFGFEHLILHRDDRALRQTTREDERK